MTQHILAEDTEQDIQTMRNLRNFVLSFVGLSIAMALAVAFFAP